MGSTDRRRLAASGLKVRTPPVAAVPVKFAVLRFLTAGESHGKGLAVIVEGLPSGLSILQSDFENELRRRRLGYRRGPRMRFEQDELELLGGIRHGRTLGSPVAITIGNSEWERKWTEEMSPAPGRTATPLVEPRPGHADLPGMQKYDFDDARDVLERASARETAARVVAGTLAKALLAEIGVEIVSHVVQMGTAESSGRRPRPAELDAVDESPVRCFDKEAEESMMAEAADAAKNGDSLGGVAEVLAYGVPVGLGSHVHWDRKLDGLLAQAFMSIQAIKAVELGDGIDVARRRGADAHDSIYWNQESGEYTRKSAFAGGIEGGISNGGLVSARLFMKPLATQSRPTVATVDVVTKESGTSFRERTDVTAVPAMGVVGESMMALVLASEALRKFGGDSVTEFKRNFENYQRALESGIGDANDAEG